MCRNRYKVKGVKGCESRHINEEILKKAFVEAFNELVANKKYFLEKWRTALEDSDALKQYRLNEFIEILDHGVKQEQFNENLGLRMLEQIKVIDGKGKLHISLLDDTNLEYQYKVLMNQK
ncbi:hypothetical protein [Cellulosilyticum sp. WCF-2]|uniref:hypothetical protein n=1 Tax=unclassified Cellulosilyticum TaxID=2643091 RepID=UPI002ED3C97B